jgi:hypothetical protein
MMSMRSLRREMPPLPGGERAGVRGFCLWSEPSGATPTQPLRPQVRPPDEPKSGPNPIEGEGF